METLFSGLFELFHLYAPALADHLLGLGADCDYTGPILYNTIGLAMLGITAVSVALYYLVLMRPSLAKTSAWVITLIINAIIVAIVAFSLPSNNISADAICLDQPFGYGDIAAFSAIVAFWSAVVFFLLSLGARFISPVGRYIPF
jgi:hypothetical protein